MASVAPLPAHAKAAKGQYAGHLTRITQKADDEAALLDHLAVFIKKRAEIERECGERLEKLAKSYSKILYKTAGSPSMGSADAGTASITSTAAASSTSATNRIEGSKPTVKTFATLVAATEDHARALMGMADTLTKSTVEQSRAYVKERVTTTAKSAELWRATQEAVLSALTSLHAAKVDYDEAVKAHDTTDKKLADATAGKAGVLTSVKQALSSETDQERISRLQLKLKNCKRRLIDTRNNYLLALASSNAAQTQYWNTDLPQFVRRIDADFHNTYASTLRAAADAVERVYSDAAKRAASLTQTTSSISRDAEAEPIDGSAALYTYESSGLDTAPGTVYVDEVGKVVLGQLLAELMRRRQAVSKELDRAAKEVSGLDQMAKIYEKTPEFGNAQNPLDTKLALEFQVVTLGNQLKQLESQIQILEQKGVSISTITSVEVPAAAAAATSVLSGGMASLNLGDPSKSATSSAFVSASSSPLPASKPNAGIEQATVLFDYEAQDSGELSIREGQTLTVFEGDSDGWTKAELDGKMGYVPTNYIKLVPSPPPYSFGTNHASTSSSGRSSAYTTPASSSPLKPMGAVAATAAAAAASNKAGGSLGTVTALFDYTAQDKGELSFVAGDAIDVLSTGDDGVQEWWTGKCVRSGEQGLFPYVYTFGHETISSAAAAAKPAAEARPGSMAGSLRSSVASAQPQQDRVKAQFSYTATCEGELSIEPGDLIVVTNRATGSDAWWEGQNTRTRATGQFPVAYTTPA